jgi:hypothetical protein
MPAFCGCGIACCVTHFSVLKIVQQPKKEQNVQECDATKMLYIQNAGQLKIYLISEEPVQKK